MILRKGVFILIHVANEKKCAKAACMIMRSQVWNIFLFPENPRQVLKEKEGAQFNCQAEHHSGTADLLSVKCQYRCNKDGTQ